MIRRVADIGPRFSISDVARILDLSASTLRMWENLGLVDPQRTPGGRRLYTASQVEHLKYVSRLRDENKLSIEAIRLKIAGKTGRAGLRYSNPPRPPRSRDTCGDFDSREI